LAPRPPPAPAAGPPAAAAAAPGVQDRKSTRLNSSHVSISYAVFCLKKKNPDTNVIRHRWSRRYMAYVSSKVQSACKAHGAKCTCKATRPVENTERHHILCGA